MKLLLTGDWHFASKNPVSRTDDYNAELFGLLDKIGQLTKRLQIEAVLHAGDIFHDKGRIPWAVFIQLIQRLAADLPMLGIPGNHDLIHDRYDSMPSTPFGALVEAELVQDISRRVYTLEDAIDPQAGAIHRVQVYGVPWPDAAQPDAFKHIPPEVDIVVAHGFATPEGGERWGQYCHTYDDLAKAAPHVRLWHFGHDHTDNGVTQLANGAQVVNIGALCRGALDHDNLTRTVKVAIADVPVTGPVTVTQVDLAAERIEHIFDLNLRAKKVAEHQQVEAFVAQLRAVSGLFQTDYRVTLAGMPLDAAVRQKVHEYIDRAEK